MAIQPSSLPGPEPAPEVDPFFQGQNLDPKTEEEHKELVNWCLQAIQESEDGLSGYHAEWEKFDKLYNMWVQRTPGDWRSTVVYPLIFSTIETIVPKLVSAMPKFLALPVAPDDEQTAKDMEQAIDWAVRQSKLKLELVKAWKSALKYGTGVLKTYLKEDVQRGRKVQPLNVPLRVPQDVPLIDPETGEQMVDMDTGQPISEQQMVETGRFVQQGMQAQRFIHPIYKGPAAEAIDIFDLLPAPEAKDIDSARYVGHRCVKTWKHVQERIDKGQYRIPSFIEFNPNELTNPDDPHLERLSARGLGSTNIAPTRKPVEIIEFWTDDGRVITLMNRKVILRVDENPFDHYEKPFVLIYDYLQEHEFWGKGECAVLEGLQLATNAIANSRIDNLRLVMNAMFAVNYTHLEDMEDLETRPGGAIRIKGDMRAQDVIERIDLGDVTPTAFAQVQELVDQAERASGISAYQMGTDSSSLNETATGTAIIQDLGNSRIGVKLQVAELGGFTRLARHYGSILQQFTTEETWMRMHGPEGAISWKSFTPESIQGALDYDIQADSTMQTQTVRMDQKMNLLQLMAQFNPMGVMAALEDVLDEMGVKDKGRYLMGLPPAAMGAMPGMPGLPPGGPGMEGLSPDPAAGGY